MFNYLFPIFCFGLVITGVVYLGIIEAAKQLKSEEMKLNALKRPDANLAPASSPNSHHPRFAAGRVND